ncbi:MAG: hypothetical protein ACKO7W_00390 [Elainella sp.]
MAIKLIGLLLVVVLAVCAFKLVGDRCGMLVGWLTAAGVACLGLLMLGAI